MRVLQVLAEDTVGGTELHVALLAERLPEPVVCEVATLCGPGPIAARLGRQNIAVWSLGDVPWPVRANRLWRLLQTGRYDVVEAYGIKASVIARLAARATRPAPAFVCGVQGLHVTEVIDAGSLKGRVAIGLERATTTLVDGYDANSQGAIELLTAHGIARERLVYIPNGVDVAFWQPRTRPLDKRPPVIVSAARLVERKRQTDLVDAAANLRDRGVDFRVELLGDGPDRSRLERQVKALDLAHIVEVAGAVDHAELQRRLARASVFALCSSWEGMPAAVLEAMSCALPVVATDVNGTRDVVRTGSTGILYPAGNVSALADCLGQVLADPPVAEAMGAAGRALVASEYSLDAAVEAKAALYKTVSVRRSGY